MSTKGLLGAVAGAAVGFVIGGPLGALYGASVGFGLGSALGASQPDIPAPGKTQVSQLSVTTAEEGVVIADFLGSPKLTGNIVWYGNSRRVEVKETTTTASGGGKGGGGGGSTQTIVTGHKYYLSWAMVLGLGPVDQLLAVYRGDECIYEGPLDCPVAGGVEQITLPGMGDVYFYFGTDDQAVNSAWAALVEDSTILSAYRHRCYVFFNDCCLGQYNRVPIMRFVVKKAPTFSFSSKESVGEYDYNPIHAVRYILEDMVGLSSGYLNDDAFEESATAAYYEDLGITALFDTQEEALRLLSSLMEHVDGVMRWGIDGKFHTLLTRGSTPVADLPIVTQDMMLDDMELTRKSWLDTLNEIKVQYPLRFLETEVAGETVNYLDDDTGDCDLAAPTVAAIGDCQDKYGFPEDGYGDWRITNGCPPFALMYRDEGMAEYKLVRWLSSRDFAYYCNKIICSGQEADRYFKVVEILYDQRESNVIHIPIELKTVMSLSGDTEVVAGGSAAVAITGGKPLYHCEVDEGSGLWFDAAYTLTEVYVTGPSVTVYADGTGCGSSATLHVTEGCLGTDTRALSIVSPGDFAFDDANTDDDMDPGETIAVKVTGGVGPYSWSTSATGYTLGSAETDDGDNTLECAEGNCGVDFDVYCTVTVEDACGAQVEFTIRNTAGGWSDLIATAEIVWDNEPLCCGLVRGGSGFVYLTRGHQRWRFLVNKYKMCMKNVSWSDPGGGWVDPGEGYQPNEICDSLACAAQAYYAGCTKVCSETYICSRYATAAGYYEWEC